MSKGILIFARNNSTIKYGEIACQCAGFAKANLKKFDEICLVTDQETYNSASTEIDFWFDRVIIQEKILENNKRMFKDTTASTQIDQFFNLDRSMAYQLSPYDETLIIDADYFVLSNALDNVWGSENNFMINKKYRDIAGIHDTDVHYIDEFTIPMHWATVIYFRKSDIAEDIFTLVTHIKEHYPYYKDLYNCAGGMFRNDYAFSIALHILNGNMDSSIPSLPIEYLNNSFDTDDIFRVNSTNDIIMFCSKKENRSEHILGRFVNTDIHIMNKYALSRHLDEFRKVLHD